MLGVQSVCSEYPKEGFFLLKHSVWNESGQGFVAERKLWIERFWQFLFRYPAIYAEDPDVSIARRLVGSNLVGIPGRVEAFEFGSRDMRSFVLMFDDDYSPAGEKLASTGAIIPVMFFEKKFDLFCRLAIEVHPTGWAGRIFAIFDEIRGKISVVEHGPILNGPLIAQTYLSEVARFSDCIYEAVDDPPPSAEYRIDLLPV